MRTLLAFLMIGCGGTGGTEPAPEAATTGEATPPAEETAPVDPPGTTTTDSTPATGSGGESSSDSSSGSESGSTPEVPLASCDVEIDGVPWDPVPVEGLPGFDAELAAVDLAALPDPVDISGLPDLFRAFIAYALGIPGADLGPSLEIEATLERGPLGEVVLASLARDNPAGLDFEFFRRGFHRYYTCSQAYPLTLDGFYAEYWDFSDASGSIIDASPAKCGPREVLANPTEGIHVARTVVGDDIRETEIILSGRRDDGALDFLVYDAAGDLTDRSEFPTMGGTPIIAASPFTCLTCHVDPEAQPPTFDVMHPVGVGACQ